jgi:hypothetical protein
LQRPRKNMENQSRYIKILMFLILGSQGEFSSA